MVIKLLLDEELNKFVLSSDVIKAIELIYDDGD
jgi:hypothetical protein